MSVSKVNLHHNCPRAYKYRYIEKYVSIKIPEYNDDRLVGKTLHHGLETSIDEMMEYYSNEVRYLTDDHVNEMIKLEYWCNVGHEFIDTVVVLHKEYVIETEDYKGIVDLITDNGDGTVDIWDYKYSSGIQYYKDTEQMDIYKTFLEGLGFKVRGMNFIFFPKSKIKHKDSESLYQFRQRIVETIKAADMTILPIEFNINKVKIFSQKCVNLLNDSTFIKIKSDNCKWCDYKKLCENGSDPTMSILPVNERSDKRKKDKMDKHIYGDSYSGKSIFMDQFPNVLFANTDGNISRLTSAVIRLKDIITTEGRITKKKWAWEVFVEMVDELEVNHTHGFERIVLDLVEDIFDYCRLYYLDKNNLSHESDAGYGKGWDLVRSPFLTQVKRLKNIGLEITYISKVAVGSVSQKNGQSITTYSPNINDKLANVLAGTVDATFYLDASGKERFLTVGKDPYIVRGSRFDFDTDMIKLDKDVFLKEVEVALSKDVVKNVDGRKVREVVAENKEDIVEAAADNKEEVVKEVKGTRQSRKPKTVVSTGDVDVKEEVEKLESTDFEPLEDVPFAETDMYFEHPESECFMIVKKGESLGFLNSLSGGHCEEISKEDYDLGMAWGPSKTSPSEEVKEVKEVKEESKSEPTTQPRRRRR